MTTSTRLTLEEFLAMPDIDERRLELIDGEVEQKMSPRWGHGRLALLLGSLLDEHGFAAVEPRAVIEPAPDRGPSAPLPDVAFYHRNPPADEDWMRRPPDVVVEILSPDQLHSQMRAKVDIYLAFGVQAVWVVDPQRKIIDVYEDGRRRTLSGDEVLTSAVVPGFRHRVGELFEQKRQS